MGIKKIHKFQKDNVYCPQGFFKVELISPEGKVVQQEFSKNIITYTGTNLFARSLGGQLASNPTHILVGGSTIIPGVFPPVNREDTELDSVTDPVVNPAHSRSELEIVAVGFSSAPNILNSSPETQNNNVVTFTAIMPGFPTDLTLNGKSFFEAGIINKQGSTNLLMTHQFHTAIQKLEGFQLVYTWSVRFL